MTQPVQNIAPTKPDTLLIASSYELDQLFNWAVFSSFPIVKEKQGYANYDHAYTSAWWWFNYITTGPLRGPRFTIYAGWIYDADLKGGGTANIREYGSSGLWPTIDTLNHGTFGINAFVREVKFKY